MENVSLNESAMEEFPSKHLIAKLGDTRRKIS